MKKLKSNMLYILTAIILGIFIASAVLVVYADTDGKELKTTNQPDKLVLQLGSDWANVEFELKLDSGVFPVPVKADKSGLLTMELGGSKTYTLTRLTTPAADAKPIISVPVAVPTDKPTTEPLADIIQMNPVISEFEDETTEPITLAEIPDEAENETETVITEPSNNTAPVLVIVLFI